MGTTPRTAEAVTVRDGTVYVDEYPALDYDSGEPVTVSEGASDAQVAQALRDAGSLSGCDKIYDLQQVKENAANLTKPESKERKNADAPAPTIVRLK